MTGIRGRVAALVALAVLGGVTGCTTPAADEPGGTRAVAVPAPDDTPTTTTAGEPQRPAQPEANRPGVDLPADADGADHDAEPAPKPLLARGAQGDEVRELQFRLAKAGTYGGPVSGYYGPVTERGVSGFQRRHDLPATGTLDAATRRALRARTPRPTRADLHPAPPAEERVAPVDERCRTGRVICVSKSKRKVYWVVDGEVQLSMAARFGSQFTPTREGTFAVRTKSRNHHSRLYDSPMPFALFFSDGQAVHYSADFAARGYRGASHGCVNTRDRAKMRRLFDLAQVGDKVVVYRG